MTIQTTPTTSLLNDQFVDMKFITHLTGLTDKWFYKLIQEGEFPKPIKLGRSSRWLRSEVEAWMQARIDESRGGNFALGS
ncbi:helix-turn-helix transcriptional regulator [Proteus mirabilis]|uniref:helix-turn-helix transcriptional regulator n=1 Tax=Proteus mirabilis TaxID=584 RepID=UPI0020250E4D|nr:AlpA family transcriptional regulator [Proteus mirabilis]MCL8617179.1 AlpA family transcriptional regulator [Proteus mirabilis]MDC6031216.1 AlpA family transcriptional regulator [Proteus mirabilis]MDC6047560.1 AlpA family transcriptional regulator [Proteus mirabilis]MDC6052315.1 AlpA family transcriptional regulator [Proteus mirabilis]MDC6062859.1 AlpA family transcriptional regulator [Proteus mirabilis]